MTRKLLSLSALILCMVLSGCNSKGEGHEANASIVVAQVLGSIKARQANIEPQPVVQVTVEQLANTKIAALQANPLNRGGSDFLRRIAQHNDDHPGTVSVWQASDGAQLFIRGGVLVGSRGVGTDIISSDATPTIRAIAKGRGGQGARHYVISNGDYSATKLTLSCNIENLGREDTQVVNLTYHTTHLRETCVGGASNSVRITNDYWIQPESGQVRRSEQWTGPLSGYFELILLKS